jgi:hypothetical protein
MRVECPFILMVFNISLFRVYWLKNTYFSKVFEDANADSAFIITPENFPMHPVLPQRASPILLL